MNISFVDNRLEARNSSISGTGVFAKESIKKGERVAIFGGYVVSLEVLRKLKDEDLEAYETILKIGYQVDDDVAFSPTSPSQFSPVEHLNHSCEPSCGFDGPIHLVAMRDINNDEEITMDYGTCTSHEMFEMKNCACGSSSCRGKVTADDWKNPQMQKKYAGFFQPYLNKKIQKLNNENIV